MILHRAVPIITVKDLRAEAAAYQRTLGLDVLMDHGWIVTLGTEAHAPQFSLMEVDETAVVNPIASLQVDDIDEVYKQVATEGFEIVHELVTESWGVRRFFFRDESGNVINVLEHVA